MSARRINIKPKWKIYTILIVIFTVGTIAFNAGTLLASYPTQTHRDVAAKISELDTKAFSSDTPDAILQSDEYKTLQSSTENTYSFRMSIASGVVSLVLGVAVVVAIYRYLRRNLITRKPVSATVFISTIAGVLVAVPSVYLTPIIMGTTIEPMIIIMLALAMPLAIGLGMLVTYLIANVAEWHYNRSHGFTED